MPYEKFVEEIKATIEEQLTEGGAVYIHTACKNNGYVRRGITFVEDGVNISPTIYLEEYYERFREGSGIQQLATQIVLLYRNVRFKHSWEGDFLKDYENIKGKIIYQLINREANQELLEEIPHIPYLDLAVIFCVLMDIDNTGNRIATMQVRREHLQWWKVEEEEIYKQAQCNTERLLPCEFMTMFAMVEELLDRQERESADKDEDMYVLTNMLRNGGAAALLYEERLEKIGLFFKENYYVLPSSVHEVIIIPESRALRREELCAIVTDINETQVPAEEILSNQVYYYNRKEAKLKL